MSSLRGRPVILYFYPKDSTPGCTRQACGIRDSWDAFAERGAVVLGVSKDSPKSHAKFKEKYELPFTLLADEDHAVAEAYGVWVQKSFAARPGARESGGVHSATTTSVDGSAAWTCAGGPPSARTVRASARRLATRIIAS